MNIMPEDGTEYGAPAEGKAEPRNIREAIAMRQELGDPGYVEVTEAEAHAYPDGTPNGDTDEFSDLFPKDGSQPPAAEGGSVPAPEAAPPAAEQPADPYSDFGGRERVQDAIVLADALRTESGVRTVVAQGLQALGYTPEQIQAFIAQKEAGAAAPQPGAAPAAADPWANIADDDVLTGGEVKQMLGTLVEQIGSRIDSQLAAAQTQAVAPLQQQIMEDRQRNARQAVDSTLVELMPELSSVAPGVELDQLTQSKIQDVQAFAARYLDANSWDPNHIASAIRRGHADMVARDEARFQAYVTSKRQAKAAAPAHIGGSNAPGGEEQPEPRNVKEAIAMRKAMGLA